MFDDLLAANQLYQAGFQDSALRGEAVRGLAVLTCIDSRIDPLAILGLVPGDAKIIRNAGARVTKDALRSLVLSANLLRVDRICVIQHTDCAMAGRSEEAIRAAVEESSGAPTDGWEFLTMTDQMEALRSDMQLIRDCELLPDSVVVGGFRYGVHDGTLTQVA